MTMKKHRAGGNEEMRSVGRREQGLRGVRNEEID